MRLNRALLDYNPSLLAAIAERRGVEMPPGHGRELADQLSAALLAPDSVQQVVDWLSSKERAALDALIAAGGRLPAARFNREHGHVRRMGPGRLEREKPWRDPASPAETLYYAGLIFFGFDQIGGQITEIAFVPDDLLPLLPATETGAEDWSVVTLPVPRVVCDAGRALAEDMTTLLSCVETDTWRPRPDLTLRSQDLLRLDKRLMRPQGEAALRSEQEAGRLGLLLHLARRLHLVKLDKQDKQLILHRPAAREWLQAAPVRQMMALQNGWRDDAEWNDLWHVPSLLPEKTGWRNDPVVARARLLEHLARCPRGEWIDLKSFIAAIKESDPDFQRPSDAYATWYIRHSSSGEYLMGFEHWEQVEGALIAYLVGAPLHWLGVTALGFEGQGGKAGAFRLTPAGEFFLGLTDQIAPGSDMPPMIAEVDLTVRALAGGNLYDRFQLARFAEWQASGEIFTYRITKSSLGRALERGIRLDQILSFLKRVTADQLPPSVQEQLRLWAARRKSVSLTRLAVLETKTSAIMSELRAHPAIAPLLGEALSPTRVLVAEGDWNKIETLLQKSGYLPSAEER